VGKELDSQQYTSLAKLDKSILSKGRS